MSRSSSISSPLSSCQMVLLLLLLIAVASQRFGIEAVPVQLSQTPAPSGFLLVQQDPAGMGRLLLAQPAPPSSPCPPYCACPASTGFGQQPTPQPKASAVFYSPAQIVASPAFSTYPCQQYQQESATTANVAHQRVKRGCCCCCKPCCCCCCCKPCCCGCALNICVKPSCCCKCCPTCQCCTGYGCKKRRRRALPLSPLIESMPLLTRPFGEMKGMKRG